VIDSAQTSKDACSKFLETLAFQKERKRSRKRKRPRKERER